MQKKIMASEEHCFCETCNRILSGKRILECSCCELLVCKSKKCSVSFPHYNNTLLTFCNYCVDEIYAKFIPASTVDDDGDGDNIKISYLKTKIRDGTTRAQKRKSTIHN